MQSFGKSQPVTRREDIRLLTGAGRYIDDVAPANALRAWFFRSPVAHAQIDLLGLDEARAMPGVHLIVTLDDLRAAGMDIAMTANLMDNRDGTKGANPQRPYLADGRVRHVGEPIAMIVADTIAQAKDAAEMIAFEFTDLPVHLDLAIGGEPIHPEAPGNLAYDYGTGDEAATEAAFASAAHKVRFDVGDNRIIVNSMEPRGCYAQWDDQGRVHFGYSGQGVWGMKDQLARAFGVDREMARVTTPDVGGGFGMKSPPYPEYFVVTHAARVLGQPVRWMSERTEAMLSDHSGRDLVSTCEIAFDEDYRITGYRVHNLSNLGAYNSNFGQGIQSQLFAKVMTGGYDIQNTWLNAKGIYTNTTQVDAYRGAGRPEAIYALERAMDYAARALNIDPWELRRRNFVPKDAFPYLTSNGELIDVGDFDKVFTRAEIEADRAGFDARRRESEARGKLRGIGICYYIEAILGNPEEAAHIEFNADGSVNLYVGTQSNGQGHETAYAQFLSDHTGIPADLIHVIQGDSDLIPTGGGTGGSRSVTTQNNATLVTSGVLLRAYGAFLAEQSGVQAADVSFDDEHFRIKGSNDTPSVLDVAAMARAAGREDLLSFREKATLPGRSYPNGAHVAEVEVDPETGKVDTLRYTVVDDLGNLMNPLLAEGQVHGGVAQGLGQALYEHTVFDAEGQLLSATFMDYAMPRADAMPMVKFVSEPVPSTANVLGMKGCGEAGTVGAMAATANAVMDALWSRGVRVADMPFTPTRVWQMLETAKMAAE
ncbi:MAG: xanthine dehydrogenase family protein molybdopterin-binding subunit [Paracoccaceae bacterium]